MNRYNRVMRLTEEERTKRIEEIEQKWAEKKELTPEDKQFACDGLRFEKLLFYPYCVDEFFSRAFLGFHDQLTDMQQIAFEGLVREWGNDVNKLNHSDKTLQITVKETRKELKKLSDQFLITDRFYSSEEYEQDKFRLLAWSKYRYLIIQRILETEIKGDAYKLYLNGQEILFDQHSLAHIFTRHYGETMKPYISGKSHFTKDFYHEEIHLAIEDVFTRIDKSGFYSNESVDKITFRYKGTLYRIYCKPAKKSVKGQGLVHFIRLSTFFPLEEQGMLDELAINFSEKQIDEGLTVFAMK